VVPYDDPELNPHAVADEAEKLVGTAGYDLMMNNCEHFVHFCATGLRRSIQVERAVKGAAIIASGTLVLGTAVLGLALRSKLRGRLPG